MNLPPIRGDPDLEHISESEQIQIARSDNRRHEEEKRAANFINITNKLNELNKQASLHAEGMNALNK